MHNTQSFITDVFLLQRFKSLFLPYELTSASEKWFDSYGCFNQAYGVLASLLHGFYNYNSGFYTVYILLTILRLYRMFAHHSTVVICAAVVESKRVRAG